jgi:hypothetical protein
MYETLLMVKPGSVTPDEMHQLVVDVVSSPAAAVEPYTNQTCISLGKSFLMID